MTLTLWTAVPLVASADEVSGDFTYTVTDDAATITKYTGTAPAPLIPSELGGKPVTVIATDAFRSNTTLITANIPDSVKEIGNSAFRGCTSLTVLSLNKVTTIAGDAFNGCVLLASVTLPESVTSIQTNIFNGCTTLTAINVDANNPAYSSVDGVLFNKDKTLFVRYPAAKPAQNSSYTIPAGVKSIGRHAFLNTPLTSVTIPDGVTTIGPEVFYYSQLTSITIPDSVTSIGNYAFHGSTSLATVTISENSKLTSIGQSAFQACTFASITIPKGITTISPQLFQNCKSLTSVTIPDGVTEIGNQAFDHCEKLGTTSEGTITIPDTVKRIGNSAFGYCSNLTSLTIPDSVTEIGQEAFQWCTKLTSLTIPEGITTIPYRAFYRLYALESITLPASVTSIGNQAFNNCEKLTKLVILNDGDTTFYDNNVFQYATTPTIWCYATNTATVAYAKTKNFPNVIMIEAPVISETELNLNTTDNDNDTLSVDDFLPGNQGESAITDPTSTAKWSSSNEDAVFVGESTGTVTAKAAGTALITVTITAEGGEKTASIPVTVAGSGATYALTVTNGKYVGAGPFVEGATVTIVADEPKVVGQVFDKWEITSSTGGTIADPTSPTTVFTMPDAAATVRATYKNVHTLTVVDGSGSGSYASGKSVAISADAAPSGKVFDTWTSSKGGSFADATSADTTFTMPDNPVTVTAKYKDDSVTPPPATDTFAVTVTGGTDGANGTYAEGATVNITANAPVSGKVFDTWTTTDGVTFANATSATTSFVMPAKAVTVIATYKDETVDPPVNPPVADNGWVYESGVWKFFKDGAAATGWIHDGKAWYYLDSDGEMQTGWIYDHNKWYYLAGNGAMKTGWVKDAGNWYYLSGNGAMVAGKWLHDTDGSWYYLSGNGKMLTGKQNIGGKAYSFKSNGVWIG
jgi:hypothetical protein